jgi:hypothetical protein
MSLKSENQQKENQYIVIQSMTDEGNSKILPEGEGYPRRVYSQVYGPASFIQCAQWRDENCKSES